MPGDWQRSNIFLLFTKGDISDPKNYGPISLLGVMYKLVASFLSESFSTLAEKYQLHHDSQISGLANSRTSDHFLHLASLIGAQTSGYIPPPLPPPCPCYSTPDPFGEDDYLSEGCEGWDTPPNPPPCPT